MSKKNTPAKAAAKATASAVSTAATLTAGNEAIDAINEGIRSALSKDDAISKLLASQLGTPVGNVIVALAMKGLQIHSKPDSAVLGSVTSAALDSAILGVADTIDLGAIFTSLESFAKGDEKNNTSTASTGEKKAQPAGTKPRCLVCEEEKKRKQLQTVFKVAKKYKGLEPECDALDGKKGVCPECITSLNKVLKEEFESRGVSEEEKKEAAALAKYAKEREDKVTSDIAHFEQKIARLTPTYTTKGDALKKILMKGKAMTDIPAPAIDGKLTPENDKLWADLFGDFADIAHQKVTTFRAIEAELWSAEADLASLIAEQEGSRKAEAKEEVATKNAKVVKPTDAKKRDANNKTKAQLSRKAKKKANKGGKK